MKALALDCAVSRMVIAAKNNDKICMTVYDIGMKQSETIVPAIEYVLEKNGLQADELDYMTITSGPGSFTGLRLGISALKAIECAFNVPIYGISSLKAYAYPYESFNLPVFSGIDARKERYYGLLENVKNCKSEIIKDDNDYPVSELLEEIKKLDTVICAGPDSKAFAQLVRSNCPDVKVICPAFQPSAAETLFDLAEKNIAAKVPPMKDFDGPVYLRASEAEVALIQK